MNNLSVTLGKMLLPGWETRIWVCTVGGTDDDGNDVNEPIMFEGQYFDAVNYLRDPDNLAAIERELRKMPDGYIMVDIGRNNDIVGSVDDLLELFEEDL